MEKYITELLQVYFAGWNDDEIGGYRTRLISVIEKIKTLK